MHTKTNTTRRLLSLILALALVCSLGVPALADNKEDSSFFNSLIEQLAAKSEEAIQRLEETGTLFDPDTYSSPSSGIMLLTVGEDDIFPETYDLRDGDTNGFGKSLITPVKDQTPWGTCWGFGVVNAAESSIIADSDYWTAENLDLSELQLAWFASTALPEDDEYFPTQVGEGRHYLYYDAENDELYDADDSIGSYRLSVGGSTTLATSVFASGTGPLLEEYAPYQGAEGTKIYYGNDDEDYWYYSTKDDWSLDEEVRYWYSFELENTNILPDAAENNAEGVEAIKSELMRGRATTVAFCADTSMPGQEETADYINPETWAHYTYDDSVPSHMVSIVGWDDTYSRYMFDYNLTDENGNLIAEYFDDEGKLNEAGQEVANWDRIPNGDGAWIAKNSWGSLDSEAPNHYNWGVGGSGYFYLSYYDTSICMAETYEFDVEASEGAGEELLVDQYDLMPAEDYLAMTAGDLEIDRICMANVFTASATQMLRTVGVITTSPNTTVTVQVYLLDEDAESPTDGTPMLETPATATFDYGGYHRIGLREYGVEDENLIVDEGQRYSVVVTYSADDDTYMAMAYSFSINYYDYYEPYEEYNYYSESVVNEGESYVGEIYTDEGEEVCDWEDFDDIEQVFEEIYGIAEFDNAPIKAYSDPVYSITVSDTENGAVASDRDGGIAGATVTLTVTPDAGYELAGLTVTDSEGDEVAVTGYTFTMPSYDVTVEATFAAKPEQSAPEEAPSYADRTTTSITLNEVADSEETAAAAEYGISVDGGETWTWQPETTFSGLSSGTTYTFAVRYAETDVYAASACTTANISTKSSSSGGGGNPDPTTNTTGTGSEGNTDTETGTTPATPMGKFTDVSDDAYYSDAVAWAVEEGITTGTGESTFSPNDVCTRAQIVTFLYRMAGSPEVEVSGQDFADVDGDAYYAAAVAWAVANGITDGVGDGMFDPDAVCTRGQIVTFLFRYIGQPETDDSYTFADVDSDAYYAAAVAWAAANSITTGTSDTTFSPNSACTRAQVVTFLFRTAG